MAAPLVLSALIDKRADLCRELNLLPARANRIQADLVHLDGVIRLTEVYREGGLRLSGGGIGAVAQQ